jgi:hypothetical protein
VASVVSSEVVGDGGRVTITGLPFMPGQRVKVTVESEPAQTAPDYPTVQDWIDSGLIGIWKDRTDIEDSTEFVNRIRERLQKPRTFNDDSDGQ